MRVLLAVAAVALASHPAAADPLDEFGFGSRAAGLAGSYLAEARGADAAHYNAGAVALAEHAQVLLGYGYGHMALDINGRDAKVLDVRGTAIGAAVPVDIGEHLTAAFGLSLYLPDQFIARVQLIPPTEPHFVFLDNDPHRLVVDPVLALRIGDYVSVGAGISLLGDAASDGITFNVGVVSGEKVGEAALDAGLPPRIAPLAGILVTPHERVRAGLTYRGELSLDLALDILANVDVAGVVTGDALVSMRATTYFTPRRVAAGVAVDPIDDLTLTGQLEWNQWSAFPLGLADLRVLVALDVTPPLVRTDLPEPGFDDTLTGRLGAELRFGGERVRYATRAGYGFVPTPVPEQVGLTSFADNDRHVFAAGFGVTLADAKPILTRPLSISVGVQWHHLDSRLTVKDAGDVPGESFSSGGDIVHAGTTVEVSF